VVVPQRTDSAGARSFLTDALGSTLALADSTGTVQTSYTFEPFGNTTVSGSTANSFAFTGRELDATGLYFYRTRYYSPGFQRFASEDPIGFLGRSTNPYNYAFNNPLSYRDPSGRCPWCVILLIGAGFGGTVEGIKAYERGCRGWDLVEAVGRGAGAGLLAATAGLVTGGIATGVLGTTELAAIGAGTIGGGFGGAVNAASNEAIESGLHQGQIELNPDEIVESTLLGAVAGGAAVRLGPTVSGGENFDPIHSPETFGPRANQAYAQAGIGGVIGAIPDIGRAAIGGRKDACHQ
jgi:RHS repeat-associated protein